MPQANSRLDLRRYFKTVCLKNAEPPWRRKEKSWWHNSSSRKTKDGDIGAGKNDTRRNYENRWRT